MILSEPHNPFLEDSKDKIPTMASMPQQFPAEPPPERYNSTLDQNKLEFMEEQEVQIQIGVSRFLLKLFLMLFGMGSVLLLLAFTYLEKVSTELWGLDKGIRN
jgi:hypothetical protein